MSETKVKWHKYPEEPIPKRLHQVLVTQVYGKKSVTIKDPRYMNLEHDIAWAEPPDWFGKGKKISENSCKWNNYRYFEKFSREDGYKLVTIAEYINGREKHYIDRMCSYDGLFVNTSKIVVVWAELPEPYKGE